MMDSAFRRMAAGVYFIFLIATFLGSVRIQGAVISSEEPTLGFGLVDALDGIQFQHPVVITSPPGATNSLFVVERFGKVYALTNLASPEKTLFLDLASSTIFDGGLETGLLGMAFHPNFQANGYFFIYRIVIGPDGYYNRLSRFRADPAKLQVEPNSEEIVLQQRDLRYIQHNAGDIHFGPEGYLYLSLGEASPPQEDYRLTRQPIDKNFFGVIIRIDVDKRPGNLAPNPHPGVSNLYLVPKDNPFVGATEYQGVALNTATLRTEIFALGLRNPWRFCFDPANGEILCGDVGEQSYEEVNVIRPGGNYGWPYMEGPMETGYFPARPKGFKSEAPLWTYLHDSSSFGGQAIIGGVVYTGKGLPELQGAYLFGDNVRGHIWALSRNQTSGTNAVKWLAGEPSLSTFGLDPRDHEILVASLITGKIRKLVYHDPAQSSFPMRLSETGLFSDVVSLTPAPGVTPYQVNASFWSDFAAKQRWFVLPAGASFTFNASNRWSAPTGTIWIKHFDLETTRGDARTSRRLETRLLVKGSSAAYGVTYRWNSAGTDATIVPSSGADEEIPIIEQGVSRLQRWRYPSRLECRLCHNPLLGDALAFNGEQLNCPDAQGLENQLLAFVRNGQLKGYGSVPPQPLATPTNAEYSVEYRVRSFMQANCAQCHFPGNPIIAHWDARFHTALPDKQLAGLVQPGSPDSSMLFTRLAIPDFLHMPPIATSELNADAIALLREWIEGIPVLPWQTTAIGTPSIAGTSLVWSNRMELTAYSGPGGKTGGEGVFRSSSGSVHALAHLSQRKLPGSSGRIGILLSSAQKDGPTYFAGVTAGGFFSEGLGSGLRLANASSDPVWLRVSAEPSGVRFWRRNGETWEILETLPNPFGTNASIGFAVSSAESAPQETFARFDTVSTMSTSLSLLEGSTNQSVFGQSRIQCITEGQNYTVRQVQFFVNDQPFGEALSEPYVIGWATNAPGKYKLSARVVTQRGFTLTTPPIQIQVEAPPAEAWFLNEDFTTLGQWQGRYGLAGFSAPGFFSWPQQTAAVSFSNASVKTGNSSLPGWLRLPNSSQTALSYWSGEKLTVSVNFLDSLLHKLTLYLVNPAGNSGPQAITITDRNSKVVLATRTVTAGNGAYVSFFVKGPVDIGISGNPEGALAGLFLDPSPYPPPAPILGPVPAEVPGSSVLTLVPTFAPNVALSGLEFYLDGILKSSQSTPPFSLLITNLPVGSHTISVRASDLQRQIAETNLTLNVVFPTASARFQGTDDSTKGQWQGVYGADGYLIVGGATNFPASIHFAVTNQTLYPLEFPANPAAPLSSPDDSAAVNFLWTSAFQIQFDLAFRDGRAHEVSLYVLDGPGVFREELVRVSDPASQQVLSELLLKGFEQGRYYTWTVQGAVRFQVITRSASALLCGIFVDPLKQPLPDVSIFSPQNGTTVSVPGRTPARLVFSDPENRIERTELYMDNRLFREFPYRAELPDVTPVLAGNHWLSAAVVDRSGMRRWSAPLLVTGERPAGHALFLFEDSDAGGGWKGKYGTEGFVIAGDSTNFVPLASFTLNPETVWYWDTAPQTTESLLRSDSGRVAACWFDGGDARTLELKLSFPDGEHHTVALYFLDYQLGERNLVVRALDTASGLILDEKSVQDFAKGTYLVWRLRGDITLQITSETSSPILSGFFVDPGLSYSDWLSYYFDALQDTGLDSDIADPDNDGIPNRVEFVAGLNPLRNEPLWRYRTDGQTGELVFEIFLARNRDGALPIVEFTSDFQTWAPAEDLRPRSRLNETQRIIEYRFPAQRQRAIYFRVGAQNMDF